MSLVSIQAADIFDISFFFFSLSFFRLSFLFFFLQILRFVLSDEIARISHFLEIIDSFST